MKSQQKTNLPQGLPEAFYERESQLLSQLLRAESAFRASIVQLAALYKDLGRPDLSLVYLESLLKLADNPEKQAECYLMLGQTMETANNYKEAIQFYKQGLSLEPTDANTWYLINNNLGFCLNYFEEYSEAEPYCREAIKINPDRHNAYKNLGISLQGLGRYAEAARLFVKSVQLFPADPRAYQHLLKILAAQPDIAKEIPDIHQQVEMCRDLVNKR